MNNRKQNLTVGVFLMVFLVAVDQITKYLAFVYLSGKNGFEVVSGVLELFYLENRGAAFGIFADKQWFFIGIAVAMILVAAFIYIRTPQESSYRLLRSICILIMAGAFGNMIDRIVHHFVIDFLYFSLIDFPVFNIADCYICIGAALALWALFTVYKDESFSFLKNNHMDC